MIEITILGSGTRVLLADHSMAGYAVRTDDFFILLDCGDGVIRRGLEAQLPMIEVDAILFSHLHLDHIADLPPLLWALYGEGQSRVERPLHLFGPPGFRNFCEGLSGLYGEWVEAIEVEIRVAEISNEEFSLGAFQIQTLPMQHSAAANGYRLQLQESVLAYTGDTGPCDEVVQLAKDADILIAECSFPNGSEMGGHLTAGEVGRLANRAGCRKVILSHLYPESLAAEVVAQCRENFSGEVELAFDLKRLHT